MAVMRDAMQAFDLLQPTSDACETEPRRREKVGSIAIGDRHGGLIALLRVDGASRRPLENKAMAFPVPYHAALHATSPCSIAAAADRVSTYIEETSKSELQRR